MVLEVYHAKKLKDILIVNSTTSSKYFFKKKLGV